MLIGRVASPFGLGGDLKVEPHTDFPDRFKALDRVYLGPDRSEFHIERVRNHGSQILLKLKGIDSPEAVRDMKRPDIYVPRAEATTLPEGHFYLDDVVGMTVSTTDGRRLGNVSEVIKTGSNEVFVVGTGRDEILIPVIRDAVHQIDLEARTVTVEPWVLDVGE